jgi:hypothetical protein
LVGKFEKLPVIFAPAGSRLVSELLLNEKVSAEATGFPIGRRSAPIAITIAEFLYLFISLISSIF